MYTDGFHFSTTCILEIEWVLTCSKCTGNGFHFSTTCTGEWVLTVYVYRWVPFFHYMYTEEWVLTCSKCTGTTCTGEWVLTVNVLEMGSTFPLHVLESGSLYNNIL